MSAARAGPAVVISSAAAAAATAATASQVRRENGATFTTVHRMQGELSRDDAVAEYKHELTGVAAFDLVLLGLGSDGHVASLFPSFPTLDITSRDVIGSESGYEPFVDRISMTLPRLCNTHELLFLATGEDKGEAVSRAFADKPSHATPGSLARSAEGTTRAILDRAAAKKL